MPPRVLPLRGLGDLRTLTGRSESQIPLHKAYLRISFLELERARHTQEMRTAQQRLQLMRNRCRQIDEEKAEILAAAEPAPASARHAADAARPPTAPARFPLFLLRHD